MKVLHFSFSDINGGASRSAFRIHNSLVDNGIDSYVYVNEKGSGDYRVIAKQSLLKKLLIKFKIYLSTFLVKKLFKNNSMSKSLGFFPSNWAKIINTSDADIIHLHWINGEMFSIRDISNIQKPIVWTLHDMWPFTAADHYTEDSYWKIGYEGNSFISKILLYLKKKYYKKGFHIIAPSKWMYDCVKQSKLMSEFNLSIIQYPININLWKPLDKKFSRMVLGLPQEKTLLLYGAIGGSKDKRKGFDLLEQSLISLSKRIDFSSIELVVFGESASNKIKDLGCKINYMGHLHDDYSLILLYNCCDVMLVPSRMDNLPNAVIESLACGIPVVAYNIGGMKDMVVHKENGYLACSFDTEDYANGIYWILYESNNDELSKKSRHRIELYNSNSYISKQYRDIYDSLLAI